MHTVSITNEYHRKSIVVTATAEQKTALGSANTLGEIEAALDAISLHYNYDGSDGDILRNSQIIGMYDQAPEYRRTFNNKVSIAEENSFWYYWQTATLKKMRGDRALYDYYTNQARSFPFVKHLPSFDEYDTFFNRDKRHDASSHERMFYKAYLR